MNTPRNEINKKDAAMRQDPKEQTISPAPAVSELHRLLGITPEEVDRQLAEFGESPEQAVAAFNAALSRAKRTIAFKAIESSAKSGAPSADDGPRLRAALSRPFYEEAVAAGTATPSSLGEARMVNASDFFKGIPEVEGHFYARVSGVSMVNAGIHDGDLILVDTRTEPRMGDIVLAHIAPHGQVVKTLACDEQGLKLESANPDYPPIRIANPEELTVHGKVVWTCGLRGR